MRGQELYSRARSIIPGGTQLLSKRPEMFLPEHWPAYYRSAKGVEVTDLDGRTYLDMSIMGVGACILGYADPEVDGSVKAAIDKGVQCTLNAPEEVELAETLCTLHPWAGMVRYGRSGGEAMAMAVRIARAHAREDIIAFCGYHGWYDWYLAANLSQQDALDGHLMPGLPPGGVPRGLLGTSLPFHYNRLDELEEIVSSTRGTLAAIVMEPQRDQPPKSGFLEGVRRIARETGAVLIFDEVTTGFRMGAGGIHLKLGIEPDIAVFAKAMANGYAMSAVIGREEVMQAAQETFISSTNWTERIGPTAALATMEKYQREKVADHLIATGTGVSRGWQQAAFEAGLQLEASGLPSLCHFTLGHDEELILSTLFTQMMLERGFLAFNQFKPSFAHRQSHVEQYLENVHDVFGILAEAVKQGNARELLRGPPARRGFYRLT